MSKSQHKLKMKKRKAELRKQQAADAVRKKSFKKKVIVGIIIILISQNLKREKNIQKLLTSIQILMVTNKLIPLMMKKV